MTQEEKIAAKRTIADFMGWIHHEDRYFDSMEMSNLKYDSSWDALMPVVEKIESIWDDFHGYFGVHISSNSCRVQGTRLNTGLENPHYAYSSEHIAATKKEATFNAVVEFINWYNKQQP